MRSDRSPTVSDSAYLRVSTVVVNPGGSRYPIADMKQEERRLQRKLANLLEFKNQLAHQDELLKELQARSQSWQGASESVMKVMRQLFSGLSDALPEKGISFDDNNDIDGLRSQILLARSKVQSGIESIQEAIGEQPPESGATGSAEPRRNESSGAADKRRVFVVHGRNMKTREAMFAFLRAVDLDPIEWEEAIRMTGGTTPYVGNVLDIAFSRAQAAVILITGDDIAYLGEQFVEQHDPAHEKQPTPQARPNVLFEMGMAFGKYPDRTLIVEFGHTRPFSDVTGRNTIHFSDNPQSRKTIADRLRSAGCLVRTDDRSDWLSAGDFAPAFQVPTHTPSELRAAQGTIATLKAEIQTRNDELITLRRDCEQRQQKIAELEAERNRETEEPLKLRVTTLERGQKPAFWYPEKLRAVITNVSGQTVHVQAPLWTVGTGNVSVQSGAYRYDDKDYEAGSPPYKPAYIGFGYKYQMETKIGRWQNAQDQWRMDGDQQSEQDELDIPPGWTFRIWIGMDPSVPHDEAERRRSRCQLGILTIPLLIGKNLQQWNVRI